VLVSATGKKTNRANKTLLTVVNKIFTTDKGDYIMVEEINSDKLDNIVSENKVVFVDCHAIWCGPCKALTPILEELDDKYSEKGLKVVKIDVDQNRSFSAQNQITGVPSVLVFAEGKKVVFDDGQGNKTDKLVGVMPPEVYEQVAENLLAETPA
jgi:thioredoxin